MVMSPTEALHRLDEEREVLLEKQEIEARREKEEDDANYLDFLYQQDLLGIAHRDEMREKRLLMDAAEATANETALAYAEYVRSANELKSFVGNLYALKCAPPFNVEELLRRWFSIDPMVRDMLVWMAQQSASSQDDSRRRIKELTLKKGFIKSTTVNGRSNC